MENKFENDKTIETVGVVKGENNKAAQKKIILIALGESKQLAVKALEDGRIMPENPSTILKVHPDVTVLCDRSAAALLDIEQVKREV